MQNYFQLIYLCFDKFKKHFQSDFLALQQHHDLLHNFAILLNLQAPESGGCATEDGGDRGDRGHMERCGHWAQQFKSRSH